MSYDIFYNKQFVKLQKTGEIIPMVLAGSNNCYEISRNGGNGRRSRSWQNMTYYTKGKISERPELIMSNLANEIAHYMENHTQETGITIEDIRKHFGYYASIVVGSGHCGDTSWEKWEGVFKNGIKNALTIEQLDQLGVNLYLGRYSSTEQNDKPSEKIIKTEDDYFTELAKWQAWAQAHNNTFYVCFTPQDTDMVLKRLKVTRQKTPREKSKVIQDYFFVLANNLGYLRRYTSRGYRYSFSNSGGKQFRTEKEADTYRQSLVEKNRHNADTWKTERINSPATFLV